MGCFFFGFFSSIMNLYKYISEFLHACRRAIQSLAAVSRTACGGKKLLCKGHRCREARSPPRVQLEDAARWKNTVVEVQLQSEEMK